MTAEGRLAARQAASWRDGPYRQIQSEVAVLDSVINATAFPDHLTPTDIDAAHSRLQRAGYIGVQRLASGDVGAAWPTPEGEDALARGDVPSRRTPTPQSVVYDNSRHQTVQGSPGAVLSQGDHVTINASNVFTEAELGQIRDAFEQMRAAVVALVSVAEEERISVLAAIDVVEGEVRESGTRTAARDVVTGFLANVTATAAVAVVPHLRQLLQIFGG